MSLGEYQFELDGYLFGPNLDVDYESFDPGGVTWRKQRAESPRDAAKIFGRDVATAPIWAWSLFVNRDNPQAALETLAQLKNAWAVDGSREDVGAVVPLRYRIGDETRMVYGRPDNFAAPIEKEFLSGRIDVTADFECADDISYSDQWHDSGTFGLLAEGGVGLTAPLEAPLTQSGVSASLSTSINVGGDRATWAIIRFYGPTQDGGVAHDLLLSVDAGAWQARLAGPLVKGEIATLDPRPWVRTTLRQDGGSFGGQMTSKMWLMKLTPGTHSLIFTANDPTGTSRCAVSWQEASSSL